MGEAGFECRALGVNARPFVLLAPGDLSVNGEAEMMESPASCLCLDPGEGRSVPLYFSTPSLEPTCSLEPPGGIQGWGRD